MSMGFCSSTNSTCEQPIMLSPEKIRIALGALSGRITIEQLTDHDLKLLGYEAQTCEEVKQLFKDDYNSLMGEKIIGSIIESLIDWRHAAGRRIAILENRILELENKIA